MYSRVIAVTVAAEHALNKKLVKNLLPVVRVDGHEFIMLVPQLAGIAVSDLGAAVASAVEHRGEVVAALDFLITGI